MHVCTGWQRLIGCLTLQIIFHKRATNYRAFLRKMTYKDKASYESMSHPTCVTLLSHLKFPKLHMTNSHVWRKVQPIPPGVTFSKAQSSNVSFATFQWKETFELWALSFETAVAPSGIGCTCHMCDVWYTNSHVARNMCRRDVRQTHLYHTSRMTWRLHIWCVYVMCVCHVCMCNALTTTQIPRFPYDITHVWHNSLICVCHIGMSHVSL